MKSCLFISIAILLFIVGCEKKIEPVKVGEMKEYRDPGFGFKIKYPIEWKSLGETGKAVFAKSQEVISKFNDPRTGEEGAQAIVEAMRYGGKTPEDMINEGRENLKQTWQNIQLMPDVPLTVGGKQGTNIRYSIPVTSKKQISGFDLYVPGDTAIYKITCLGFGDYWGAYGDVFTAMLNSFELSVVVAKKSDQWAASGNLETYNSNFFTMKYPDNLEFASVKKGAKDDLAMELHADRLDCSIHIDVFGAQKLPVEKVWEQNKGRYNAKTTGQTKIDDQSSFWADYSPRKDISSRVYFVVKNDKVVRITINYNTPQKDIYFTVFENMVRSIKLK